MSTPPKKAIIINNQIVYGDDISSNVVRPNELLAKHYREAQKKQFRKELLQKNQVDYYRAYPEQAENLSHELRRHLS